MSRAAMNEMQAVLLEIRAELAIASKNCESLTEEADPHGYSHSVDGATESPTPT